MVNHRHFTDYRISRPRNINYYHVIVSASLQTTEEACRKSCAVRIDARTRSGRSTFDHESVSRSSVNPDKCFLA